MFKYLGRPLERSYDNWTVVPRNIRKARQVWGRIGNMIQREGAEPDISAKLYCAVIHEVLLFGEENWVLSAPMLQILEGVHVEFL